MADATRRKKFKTKGTEDKKESGILHKNGNRGEKGKKAWVSLLTSMISLETEESERLYSTAARGAWKQVKDRNAVGGSPNRKHASARLKTSN